MSPARDAVAPIPERAPSPKAVPAPSQGGRRRPETRRAQILTAAALCFARDGFHGASIAQISKAAGMSPGHIYHYFENKEAIIAAIVEQDLARVLSLTAQLNSARDVRGAMIERVAQEVQGHLDPAMAALRLEIAAESARNPTVAGIVRSADARSLAGLAEMIRGVRRSAGFRDSDGTAAALAETVAALFEGLLIRTVRSPGLNPQALVGVYRRLIQDLLMQPSDLDP